MLLLVISSFQYPTPNIWLWIPIAFSVAVLYNFPLYIRSSWVSLVQIVTLTSGLLYGPVVAGWGVVFGVIFGYFVRVFWNSRHASLYQSFRSGLSEAGLVIGQQILPLILSTTIFGQSTGIASIHDIKGLSWSAIQVQTLMFLLLHALLMSADLILTTDNPETLLKSDLPSVLLAEVASIPVVLSMIGAYPQMGDWVLMVLACLAILMASIIHRINVFRTASLRSSQELSILSQVSEVLRSNLDLEMLLTTIQERVTQLMEVDNFYVALFEPGEGKIWYPLAVKHGKRQTWSPRQITNDRLTDRVINDKKPLLLGPRNQDSLGEVGLPPSEDSPYSWMGVPLVTPERTIGCLATFSISAGKEFSPSDLNLLSILSGEIGIAIDNALLYDQVNRRANQLETLNQITRLITGSLNQHEVLEQVCRSVTQVGGGDHSAIFLLDPEKGNLFLAYAYGLSAQFSRVNKTFSANQSERMRCLRTGNPVLAPTISTTTLDAEYIGSLHMEGIQAYGEFPLTTSDGHIGILCVYFDSPHTLQADELKLIQTFASQAALAVANSRLYARVDMALSRRADQLSILEAVGRELSAAISSERLFELIVDYALNFTHSTWGELSIYNPQNRTLDVKAARGYPVSRTRFTIDEGLAGRAIRTRQTINTGNVKTEDEYIDLTNGAACSQICVPLIHEDRVLGALSLLSAEENAYSESDQSFINQLARQAAVAVINAELYREAQRRLKELSMLHLISTRLVVNPELAMVMQTVARAMESSLRTSSVGIYLWDESTTTYRSRFYLQPPSQHDCNLPSVFLYADLEELHPALVKTGPLRITTKRGLGLIGECTNCQALVFPLVASKQRLGMVLIHIPKNQVVLEEELQLLRAIVAQVSISIQNALLYQDISRTRDRLAAVLNSAGEGILMLETNGVIMLANNFIETITNLPNDQIVNRWLPNLPESALQALGYTHHSAEVLVRTLEESKAITETKTIIRIHDAKSERVLERVTFPVLNQTGMIIGWLIILRDVTEEHQIAEARELITGTLVHDLRSPVSAVLSAVDIVESVLPEEQKDHVIGQALQVARSGSNRVLGLVDSLLDIARMQSGKMEMNLAAINLATITAGVVAEYTPQANEYGIILRDEVPADLPLTFADSSKITRVIANLLDNGLKFTPAGGQVILSAEVNRYNEICFMVSDTGQGIPEEYRDKIFERFTQVPGTRGRRRGSGLGLTFCRMAIEAHGGRIWVESQDPPQTGSIFKFTLPTTGYMKET